MSSAAAESKPDTVPGLGFKDKEKAQETIKILEGRDPDYQKLAVKGLIGRAKRTLTLTKDKEKLQNINDALSFFDEWLQNFEKMNLSKENRPYLPLNAIKALLPLKAQYKIESSKEAESFLKAYEKEAKGEYKNLRTISSGSDQPTWDIVRNTQLKKLLKSIEEDKPDLWEDDLPTKEHMEIILWAYSPDASKIKKNLSKFEEKLGKNTSSADEDAIDDEDKSDEDESEEDKKTSDGKKKKPQQGSKRKSDEDDEDDRSSSSDESPRKKKKGD